MNDENLKALKKEIAGVWAYYKHDQIPDMVLRMYVTDFSGCDPVKVIACYERWRRDPTHRGKMPLPADIIAMLQPKLSVESASREAASRVIGAVSRFGGYRSKEARPYIGELGWEAMMRMFGSWESICRELTIKEAPIVNAQIRDLCKAIMEARSKGVVDSGPSLPEPDMPQVGHDDAPANRAAEISEMIGKLRSFKETD